MKARKGTNLDGSRAYTQGPGTTYMNPANALEAGHRSKVSEGVAW